MYNVNNSVALWAGSSIGESASLAKRKMGFESLRVHFMKIYYCNCGNSRNRKRKYCSICIKNRIWCKGKPSGKLKISLLEAKTSRVRKRILVEQRGYKCEVCLLSDWMNELIPLEIDHIDGNSDNNSPNNLRLICLNCHGQTKTFKAKNKGRGRFTRLLRYRNNKSW